MTTLREVKRGRERNPRGVLLECYRSDIVGYYEHAENMFPIFVSNKYSCDMAPVAPKCIQKYHVTFMTNFIAPCEVQDDSKCPPLSRIEPREK
jgi:hypothetical protein